MGDIGGRGTLFYFETEVGGFRCVCERERESERERVRERESERERPGTESSTLTTLDMLWTTPGNQVNAMLIADSHTRESGQCHAHS